MGLRYRDIEADTLDAIDKAIADESVNGLKPWGEPVFDVFRMNYRVRLVSDVELYRKYIVGEIASIIHEELS